MLYVMRPFACCILIMVLVTVLTPYAAISQEITFRGEEVMQLARVIKEKARQSYQLPSCYRLPMANGHDMVISAANAFELLSRAMAAWQEKSFNGATVIPLLISDIEGADLDEKLEPKRAGLTIAVCTVDIGNMSPAWLKVVEARKKIMNAMHLETGITLTAAQWVVAMAVMIDDTVQNKKVPDAIAIPLVRSPLNWLDTQSPMEVKPPVPIVERADLTITLNGIDVTDVPPAGIIPPFRGFIKVEFKGRGAVGSIRFMINGKEAETFEGNGPHQYEIDSYQMPDGQHTLSATLVDTSGRSNAYIFAFIVTNGRVNGFTPAELPEKVEKTAATGMVERTVN